MLVQVQLCNQTARGSLGQGVVSGGYMSSQRFAREVMLVLGKIVQRAAACRDSSSIPRLIRSERDGSVLTQEVLASQYLVCVRTGLPAGSRAYRVFRVLEDGIDLVWRGENSNTGEYSGRFTAAGPWEHTLLNDLRRDLRILSIRSVRR